MIKEIDGSFQDKNSELLQNIYIPAKNKADIENSKPFKILKENKQDLTELFTGQKNEMYQPIEIKKFEEKDKESAAEFHLNTIKEIGNNLFDFVDQSVVGDTFDYAASGFDKEKIPPTFGILANNIGEFGVNLLPVMDKLIDFMGKPPGPDGKIPDMLNNDEKLMEWSGEKVKYFRENRAKFKAIQEDANMASQFANLVVQDSLVSLPLYEGLVKAGVPKVWATVLGFGMGSAIALEEKLFGMESTFIQEYGKEEVNALKKILSIIPNTPVDALADEVIQTLEYTAFAFAIPQVIKAAKFMKTNLPTFAVGGAVAGAIEGNNDPNEVPMQEFRFNEDQPVENNSQINLDDQSAIPGTVNEYGFEKTSNLLKAGMNVISKKKTPVFNSAVKQAVENIAEKGSGEQILGSIKNVPGVKANEIKWIGLDDFLKDKKTVTKKEVIDFVEANRIDVTEVVFPKTGKDFGMYDDMLKTVRKDKDKFIMSLDRSMSGGDYDHLTNFDSIKIKNFSDETFNGHTLEQLDFSQFRRTDIFKYITGFTDVNTHYTDIDALIKNNGVNDNKQLAFYLVEDNKSGKIKILNKKEIGKNPRKYKEKNPNSGGTYKHIFTSGLDVKEVEKFALEYRSRIIEGNRSSQEGTTQYERYTEKGGDDYKELILKYRQSGVLEGTERPIPVETNVTKYDDLDSFDIQESPHFREPNELAQVRFKTRNLNGKKLLSVEEMQSDLVQGVKKNNQDIMEDATPNRETGEVENMDAMDNIIKDFPFKNNWYELAIKRLVRYAADNGFDAISIPKASVIQDRYNLTRRIADLNITYFDEVRNEVGLMARDQNGVTQIDEIYTFDRIQKEFGDNILDRVIKKGPKLDDADPLVDVPLEDYPNIKLDKQIEIGGEGKSNLYNKALPAYFKKYGKKWNAKVYDDEVPIREFAFDDEINQMVELDSVPGSIPVTVFELTPAMKKSVQEEGQSLFEILGIGAGAAVGSNAVLDNDRNNTISNLTQ